MGTKRNVFRGLFHTSIQHSPTSSHFVVIHNVSLHNLDLLYRLVLASCLDETQLFYHTQSALHPSEDRMLSVQPRRGGQGDEELASICVGPGVCHAQNSCAGVFQ